MKLLLDDKTTRGCNLNANEACIFAAILKCTRAGRGWYGNYRELAAAMPFVISHVSVYRAGQKLLNLGLIERREEKLLLCYIMKQSRYKMKQLCYKMKRLCYKMCSPLTTPL